MNQPTPVIPKGFKFGGVAAGIKPSGKKDICLIVADQPCTAAGVYTQNIVRAASIDWNREITPAENSRCVVINSGNANACTGETGARNNFLLAAQAAVLLDVAPEQVIVLSTGIIGRHLPMEMASTGISDAFDQLGESQQHFVAAATAMLTTDKSIKVASRQFAIDGQTVSIAAMAKGAGMIGPNMATLLCVVTTDIKLSADQAQSMISKAAEKSFNRISVEGHMSTNDALVLLASGKSDLAPTPKSLDLFTANLDDLCIELARMIPADGEGSTHLITICVNGAPSDSDAERVARCVASSNLVKTAITGADPNWGRIVSAAGYAGIAMEPQEISLVLNGHPLFTSGQPVEFEESIVSDSIRNNPETIVEIAVGNGPGKSVHWTSDLTVEYVRFNSEYTT